jgi:23S rRNA (guanosine2251-2'-O)-methyltransferase
MGGVCKLNQYAIIELMKYDQVEGKNSVLEVLRGRRAAYELLLASNLRKGKVLEEILQWANRKKVPISTLPPDEIDRLARSENHQGVILRTEPYRYTSFRRLLERIGLEESPPLLVILDGIMDPQNLGSIIRTSGAAGVIAVILPRLHSVPVTPVVYHVACGAVEHVSICTVPNLVNAIQELKKAGIWVVGAEANAETSCFDADLTGRLALVLGSEDRGLSRLVRESCDQLVRIPLFGKISSLNVSVAAGILLFESRRQRDMR